MHLVRSLMVRIWRSTSGTCSWFDTTLIGYRSRSVGLEIRGLQEGRERGEKKMEGKWNN
jgi:hypothetical protein